jgi:hypothetical protein
MRMRRWKNVGVLLLAAVVAGGCVNQQEQHKRDMMDFLSKSRGEWHNEDSTLFIAPVYARMIGLDTFYMERVTPKGTTGRLVALELSGDGKKVIQYAYGFAEQNRWRELRANPELLSALMQQDVRPAGTCDIKLADDLNSLSYSCNGNEPVMYQRVQHTAPE